MNNTKALDKIQKLLAITRENGATENEAINAALMAQKLMAEYDIELKDANEAKKEDMSSIYCDEKKSCKWKYHLAAIVANGFCCRTFNRGNNICFFGYPRHIDVAKNVFTFLFNTGNKLAANYCYEYRKRNYSVKGVSNAFLFGFCNGIKEALDAQCTALMIITPPEVNAEYDIMTKGWKNMSAAMTMRCDSEAQESGRIAGRVAMGQAKKEMYSSIR